MIEPYWLNDQFEDCLIPSYAHNSTNMLLLSLATILIGLISEPKTL